MAKVNARIAGEAAEIVVVPDWRQKRMGAKWLKMMGEYERAATAVAVNEKIKKNLGAALCVIMIEKDAEHVNWDGQLVKVVNRTNYSLNKKKLLELGVSVKIINKATKKSVSTFLSLGKEKAGEE